MKKILCVALCVVMLAACVGCSSDALETPAAASQPDIDLTPEPEPVDKPEAGTYVPGTYTVNVRGMSGKFDVNVTFDAESIVSVEIPEHHETENIGTRAIDVVIPAIIEAQSTDVDGVSGATITGEAIKTAVNEAIEQAKP